MRDKVGFGLVVLVGFLIILQLFLPDRGVGFVTGIVVYLISWWVLFFTMLPIGVRGQQEDEGGVVPGSEVGAPVHANIKQKMGWTSQITAVFWLVFFVIVEFQLFNLEDIPTFFAPEPYDLSQIVSAFV